MPDSQSEQLIFVNYSLCGSSSFFSTSSINFHALAEREKTIYGLRSRCHGTEINETLLAAAFLIEFRPSLSHSEASLLFHASVLAKMLHLSMKHIRLKPNNPKLKSEKSRTKALIESLARKLRNLPNRGAKWKSIGVICGLDFHIHLRNHGCLERVFNVD